MSLRSLLSDGSIVLALLMSWAAAAGAAETFTTLGASSAQPSAFESVTLTATVYGDGAVPTGTVTFKTGNDTLGGPVVLTPGAVRIGKLSAKGAHSCALLEGGNVACWGANASGEVRPGSNENRTLPTLVPGIEDARDVAAGTDHSCAILDGGTVKCWGRNAEGQLGDGTTQPGGSPVTVADVSNAAALALGAFHSCALVDSGSPTAAVKCWGAVARAGGILGDGLEYGSAVAQTVAGLDTDLPVAITAGADHTCALLESGAVACWGANADGQFGDGTTTGSSTARLVAGLSAKALAAGNAFTCAILTDDRVACTGLNDHRQLGNPTTDITRPTIVDVEGLPTTSTAIEIAAGAVHACVRLLNRQVFCWGGNGSGQLGRGTDGGAEATPAAVTGATFSGGITAGSGHVCGYEGTAGVSDGTASCWGDNAAGQIGDGGTASSRATPAAVSRSVMATASRSSTFSLPGPQSITAVYSGDASSDPSTSDSLEITVVKAAQQVSLTNPGTRRIADGAFSLEATSNAAGATMGFQTSTATCTVTGAVLTPVSAGTCTVTATAAETAAYLAGQATTSFMITDVVPKRAQTIAFALKPDYDVNAARSLRLQVSASSGLPVSLTSRTPNICALSGSTLTFIGLGTCRITASQSGNAGYAAAAAVTRSARIHTSRMRCCLTARLANGTGSPVAKGGSATIEVTASIPSLRAETAAVYLLEGAFTLAVEQTGQSGVQPLATFRGVLKKGKGAVSVPTASLPPGAYNVRISADGDPLVGKVDLNRVEGAFEIMPKAGPPKTAVTMQLQGSARTVSSLSLTFSAAAPKDGSPPGADRIPLIMAISTGLPDGGLGGDGSTAKSGSISIAARTYKAASNRFESLLSAINEVDAGDQIDPAAVTLKDGSMATAWTHRQGSKSGIRGRLLERKGKPVGREFDISEGIAAATGRVALGALDGGLIAVWESRNGLKARTFDSKGKALGAEVTLGIRGKAPHLTALAAGNRLAPFLLAFRDDATGRPVVLPLDGTTANVSLSLELSRAAIPADARLTGAALYKRGSAGIPSGEVAYGWAEVVKGKGKSEDVTIAVVTTSRQRPMRLRSAIANTIRTGNQSNPSLIAFPTGGFAVTWTTPASGGSDIVAALFSNRLEPYGSEFSVATAEKGAQSKPAITPIRDTGFLIAWLSSVGKKVSVEARQFDMVTMLPR